MKSPRRSRMSYSAATNLFFVLAAIIVALAGLLPPKYAAAATREATANSASAAQDKGRETASLKLEEWRRLTKSL
ncbi:MAG: hypothetical protein H6R04_1136 [Burkholderiaceae bacterium]|nr:hypothetical protein [Burkholderiaceae bacterium]